MKTFLMRSVGLPAIAFLLLSLSFFQAHAEEVRPVIERPALISDKAPQSVLLDVTAAENRLIAVGERGHILVSIDNGVSWQQKPSPVSVTLTAVQFASARTGWAVGHSGIVLNTKDGGESWRKQLDGYQAADLFLAAVKARKTNEGDTERDRRLLADAERLVADGADKPFLDICFTDQQQGFIVGAYNLIFHTADGGETWLPWMEYTDNPGGYHMYRMVSVGNAYYVAGELGLLMHSGDRGDTFKALSAEYEGSYFGVISLRNGDLIAYGLRGHAYRSTDSGATWAQIETGTNASISDAVELRDGTLLLVTLAGEVLISNDRAQSFSALAMENAFPFSAATQAPNGDLVLVGARGVTTVAAGRFTHSADKTSGDHK